MAKKNAVVADVQKVTPIEPEVEPKAPIEPQVQTKEPAESEDSTIEQFLKPLMEVIERFEKQGAAAIAEFHQKANEEIANIRQKTEVEILKVTEPEITPTEPELYRLQAEGFPEHQYPYPDTILPADLKARWERQRLEEYCSRFPVNAQLVEVIR